MGAGRGRERKDPVLEQPMGVLVGQEEVMAFSDRWYREGQLGWRGLGSRYQSGEIQSSGDHEGQELHAPQILQLLLLALQPSLLCPERDTSQCTASAVGGGLLLSEEYLAHALGGAIYHKETLLLVHETHLQLFIIRTIYIQTGIQRGNRGGWVVEYRVSVRNEAGRGCKDGKGGFGQDRSNLVRGHSILSREGDLINHLMRVPEPAHDVLPTHESPDDPQ